MKVYEFNCYTTLLKEYNRKIGCSIVFSDKEEAIRTFKIKSKEYVNKFIDEAISFHQCLGIDPNDFEYGGEDISFNLETENFKITMRVLEIKAFDTIEEASEVYAIFDED